MGFNSKNNNNENVRIRNIFDLNVFLMNNILVDITDNIFTILKKGCFHNGRFECGVINKKDFVKPSITRGVFLFKEKGVYIVIEDDGEKTELKLDYSNELLLCELELLDIDRSVFMGSFKHFKYEESLIVDYSVLRRSSDNKRYMVLSYINPGDVEQNLHFVQGSHMTIPIE